MLVTGTLFAVVLSMIAKALVVGSRTQSTLSHKIAVHRQASMALDAIVRNAEMARLTGNVELMEGATPTTVPTVFTSIQNDPSPPKELLLSVKEGGATIYDAPLPIVVGYFLNKADNTLREMHYPDDGTWLAIPGTPADGKVLARDVRQFDVKLESNPVPVLTVRVRVASIAEPIVTQTTLE